MENSSSYISILVESLNKKIKILDEILNLNKLQQDSVSGTEIDEETFNETIDKKDECIKAIEELDKGFETVYNHVKEEMLNNTSTYNEEIKILKQLIGDITEKSMEVHLSEKRNENIIMKRFSDEKKKIYQTKNANKVASNYYNNMNKVNYIDPQFMDKKK